MPLLPGKANVGKNIKELESTGHKRSQAIAIALKEAGESKSKNAAATAPGGANTFVPSLDDKKPLQFNKDEFVTVEHVPIFDEHDGQAEGLDLDFTPEVLQRIIDACNSRIADTGDYPVLTDGHTHDDPSLPHPDTLGFASNFCMDTIGKDNPRKAIFCDMHFFKDKAERAKQLPRRSIELWPDMVADPIALNGAEKPVMDGIALLGAERPARDLGLLFSKKQTGRARYHRELQSVKENMNPEEIIKQCVEALTNTPEFAYLHELMSQKEAEAADAEKAEYEAEEKTEEEDKEKFEEEKKDDETAEGDSEDEKEEVEPAKLRMQRDQERRKYAKLESNYKALFAKVEALEREKRIADRKADLLQLEAEGYAFDMAEEIEEVADMTPARFEKHIAKIRKNYQKAPVGVNVKPAAPKAEGGIGPENLTPDQVADRAIKLAQEKYKK